MEVYKNSEFIFKNSACIKCPGEPINVKKNALILDPASFRFVIGSKIIRRVLSFKD